MFHTDSFADIKYNPVEESYMRWSRTFTFFLEYRSIFNSCMKETDMFTFEVSIAPVNSIIGRIEISIS